MSWLLDLIPGGGVTALVTALLALMAGAFAFWTKAEKSGYNKKEVENAKEAQARIEAIKRAHAAKPTGSVSDDPHNRDNWPEG